VPGRPDRARRVRVAAETGCAPGRRRGDRDDSGARPVGAPRSRAVASKFEREVGGAAREREDLPTLRILAWNIAQARHVLGFGDLAATGVNEVRIENTPLFGGGVHSEGTDAVDIFPASSLRFEKGNDPNLLEGRKSADLLENCNAGRGCCHRGQLQHGACAGRSARGGRRSTLRRRRYSVTPATAPSTRNPEAGPARHLHDMNVPVGGGARRPILATIEGVSRYGGVADMLVAGRLSHLDRIHAARRTADLLHRGVRDEAPRSMQPTPRPRTARPPRTSPPGRSRRGRAHAGAALGGSEPRAVLGVSRSEADRAAGDCGAVAGG
jgi:hypothetical protein